MNKGLLVLVLLAGIVGGIYVFSSSVERGSQPGPNRPSPEQSPRDPEEEANCEGTRLSPGDDLAEAIETERDEGVTFCLEAGSYEVPKDIDVQDGDQVIGAGN